MSYKTHGRNLEDPADLGEASLASSRRSGVERRRVALGVGALLAALAFGAGCTREHRDPGGTAGQNDGAQATASGQVVVDWNTLAFDVASQADGYKDPFLHLRAITMMHLAMHDAANAASTRYAHYALTASDGGADAVVAAAAAAHGVLYTLYPGQRELIDARLRAVSAAERNSVARDRGIALGKAAAEAVLAARSADGSGANETYKPRSEPGGYRFVPPFDLVYRPAWRNVEPFALDSGDQYRSKPPPALDSAEYAADYDEVRTYGRAADSTRKPEQTFYADWWYELSEIGWNRIARVTWPAQPKQNLWFTARLFALLNAGLMDAYVAGWDSKLHYDFWRPYTAIRAGGMDGNDATLEDSSFEPYCVTPPVQDYPSTHAALGAAGATILRRLYGRDVPFTMESSSTKPPGQKRSFSSFERAAAENADSRVACGIHFRFATRAGLELGKRVGRHVLEAILPPSQAAR